jgi:Cd2+/Zn2+-exporting ATPase
MEQLGLDVTALRGDSAEAEVWVARRELLGVIYLRDQMRAATPAVIAALKKAGDSVVLISGDRAHAAEAIAREAGIDEVHADLAPNEKLDWIHRWQKEGKIVAMVGDGINDAPSLIAADVGLGMGARGSDAALEQADVILMHDRIENVPAALRLSRRARTIIRQNLVVSLGTVAVLVGLALAQKINLSLGVVGHEGSTVLVVLNGLRLLRLRPGRST